MGSSFTPLLALRLAKLWREVGSWFDVYKDDEERRDDIARELRLVKTVTDM